MKKRTSENLALFVKNSGRQGFQDGHFDEHGPEAREIARRNPLYSVKGFLADPFAALRASARNDTPERLAE